MILWPLKYLRIETKLPKEEISEIITNSTDQDQKSIYWGKRFYKRYWGRVGKESFKIRPVVPYWNISPVQIEGEIKEGEGETNYVQMRLICPYLRIVVPLAILAVGLFLLNFGLKGEMGVFLSSAVIILFSAYLLVNIPFQIQSVWSVKTLVEKLNGNLQYRR